MYTQNKQTQSRVESSQMGWEKGDFVVVVFLFFDDFMAAAAAAAGEDDDDGTFQQPMHFSLSLCFGFGGWV